MAAMDAERWLSGKRLTGMSPKGKNVQTAPFLLVQIGHTSGGFSREQRYPHTRSAILFRVTLRQWNRQYFLIFLFHRPVFFREWK